MKKIMEKAVITAGLMEVVAFLLMWSAANMSVMVTHNIGLVGLAVALTGVAIIPATYLECRENR